MVSTVTGAWFTDDALDPTHWGRHLRQTVRFHDAATTLLADPDHAFIEVGPGGHLAALLRRHPEVGSDRLIVAGLGHPRGGRSETEALLRAVGALWCAGAAIDLGAFDRDEQRHHVPLPAYPFARVEHVLAALGPSAAPLAASAPLAAADDDAAPAVDADLTDPTARALGEIWSDLLGVSVRAGDNFFELGGSSLIAIHLRARIRDRLGVTIPTHALVEHPTLRELAAFVDQAPRPSLGRAAETPAHTSLLVRLRDGRPDAAPLYFIQPIGGTVYTYLALARALQWPGAIHGVRASGMDPGEPVLSDMRTITERYLEEVLQARPDGPLVLGGHSAGGVIAHAMAQELEARGRPVSLVLLDAPSLPAIRGQAVKSADDLLRELATLDSTTSTAHKALVAALSEGSALGSIMLATWDAIQAFDPAPIRSDMLYVAAHEQRDERDLHAGMYWMSLTSGDYAFHRCPGDHFTMMEEPQVQRLARILDRYLGGAAIAGSQAAQQRRSAATP
jgi:thioesterase domain-containing protein/acyl carrier protein